MGGVIALVADVHGNRWALEAVLEDLERRGIHEVVNLGDTVYGPLDPRGTFEQLRDLRWPTVRGNQDRVLLQHAQSPAVASVAHALGAEGVAWIRRQTDAPFRQGAIHCCHGTPERDDAYLLEVVEPSGHVRVRAPTDLDEATRGLDAPVVACGHSHVPRAVSSAAGRLFVNPGSVGLPAYDDDAPVHHRMEAGSPHARYAILEFDGARTRVEFVAVPYDHETAARAAEANGRPDWAVWIRTGFAR